MSLSWALFAVVTTLYLLLALRGLWAGRRRDAWSVVILLLGSIGVVFVRQTIEGGTLAGAARLATTAAAGVLIATLGRPERMLTRSSAEDTVDKLASARTLKYQVAFVALGSAWIMVAAFAWPSLYD